MSLVKTAFDRGRDYSLYYERLKWLLDTCVDHQISFVAIHATYQVLANRKSMQKNSCLHVEMEGYVIFNTRYQFGKNMGHDHRDLSIRSSWFYYFLEGRGFWRVSFKKCLDDKTWLNFIMEHRNAPSPVQKETFTEEDRVNGVELLE